MKTPLLVLCGHGIWLQMATALVARHLHPFGYRCLALELSASGAEPASLACGPELETVCQMLGLPLSALLQQASASYTLGCHYQANSKQWFVPFGDYGVGAGTTAFAQTMLAGLRQQPELSVDVFSAAAVAASQGKFGLAPANRPDLQGALRYGLQLSGHEFAACLRRYNQQLGVSIIASQSMQLQYGAAGYVEVVQLDNGQQLQPDYLLDCRPQPDAATAGTIYELSAQQPLGQPAQPYSSAIQTKWGWLVKRPLQHRCHWHTEFNANGLPLATVQQQLAELTGIQQWQVQQKPRQQQDSPWQHNHLRWGQAAAGLDCPLYSGIAPLQYLVVRWLDLLSAPRHSSATAMLYNQHWQHYQSEVQQFLQLHQQPLATEAGKVFSRLGRLPATETDAIKPAQWFGLLCGLTGIPQLPGIAQASAPAEKVQHNLQQIRQQLDRLVAGMPPYALTLSRCLQSLSH